MRSTRLVLFLFGTSLLTAGCLTLDQCINSRGSTIDESLKGAATGDMTIRAGDFRLALCGFVVPWDRTFRVEGAPKSTFSGDNNSGTGETTATLVTTSKESASDFRCEGRVAFSYRYRKQVNHPDYYEISDIRRIGDPPSILATIEEHAQKVGLDTPATAFSDGWKLPDGRIGAAYRVNIPEAGAYTVSYGAKKFEAYKGPLVSAFQDRKPVVEGDHTGALGFWKLESGEVLFLISGETADPLEVRITRDARSHHE